MKRARPTKNAVVLECHFDAEGPSFRPSKGLVDGWWRNPQIFAEASRPMVSYLDQLETEGHVSERAGGLVLSWPEVYALIGDQEHAGSLGLLELPAVSDWVPQIQTRGAFSDADFRLVVDGWWSPTLGNRNLQRSGAILRNGGQSWLMPADSWSLLTLISEFTQTQSTLDADGVIRAVGAIRQSAKACGAPLDEFLERTDIRTPDRVRLELRRDEALGSPVIEIRPLPEGVPEEFIENFDRYDQVRHRYDLIQPRGVMTYVAPGEGVRSLLKNIKAMPARRMSADQTRLFVHNPFAVLGTEAAEVIDETEFSQARRDAGLLPSRLEFIAEESDEQTAAVQVASADPDVAPERLWLGSGDISNLLRAAGKSRARALPMFHWEGSEISLDQHVESQLARLADWLVRSTAAHLRQDASQVLDLSAFSDRVVGFDSRIQAVPYVAHRQNGNDWLPSDDIGIITVDRESGGVQQHRMSPESLRQLSASIAAAKEAGLDSVRLPDSDIEVSIVQAESLEEEFEAIGLLGSGKAAPAALKEPKANQRVGLKILHNIESLEYVKAIEDLIGEVDGTQVERPVSLRPEIDLLPHQLYGLGWMEQRYLRRDVGIAGCLLADDMGLGKTLQALSLITWAGEHFDFVRPSLVVAPVSLLENWKQEIAKFLDWPDDVVLSLYGSDLAALRAGSDALDKPLKEMGITKLLMRGFADGYRLVLTTYETLRDYELSIARQHWDIVVCDEAQKIKNPTAFVTQAAKALKADFKIACTGTPVENSLADLWCLFDFFQPGCLGALNEFTKSFRQSIESRQDGHEELVERLREIIQPWVLRRMKYEVQQGLPRKITGDEADTEAQVLPMSAAQRSVYSEVVAEYREAKKQDKQDSSVSMLNLLHRLRMICANPLSALREDHELLPIPEHLKISPKLAWLIETLTAVKKRGEKAIIFTDYRVIQRLLQRAIDERFGFRPEIINGATAAAKSGSGSRQDIIDNFQSTFGFSVLILSASAVGFGVNIQEANHVIHFTRTWNPAKEDQATDRAYRIGQTRDVYVYCPTVAGPGYESFEQRLAQRLDYKRDLSKDMLAGAQELSIDDFDDL